MSLEINEFLSNAKCSDKKKIEEKLIKSLQILSATDDLSIFDPGSFQVGEFYSVLHDVLLQSSHSELIWSVVCVLQVAVHNPNACSALGHIYHFLSPLTTLLDTQLSSERQMTVLKIMQELSYGITIQWQETHLPRLIQILLDIIKSHDNELIPVALGVMVNICHKNKPAVHTLMNTVSIKAFLRIILNLQRENLETSVQVCKLVMVLDDLTDHQGVPDTDILTFVRVSFIRIKKAFKLGNTNLMRHIVDFFRDAKESEHGKKVLLTYPSYPEEMDKLISTLSSKEPPNNWQCVRQLMEFLLHLVNLELAAIASEFVLLAGQVLPWLRVTGVTQVGLQLLAAILRQCQKSDKDKYRTVCSCVEGSLEMLVELLHTGCKAESLSSEDQSTLTSLLQLLNVLASDNSLSTTITTTIDKEELKKLLLPLVSQHIHDGSHLFEQPVIALYVEVLSFVSKVSMHDKGWLFMYSDLLQKKQILKAFAVGLYFGPNEIKKKILFLAGTTSFSNECITVLSKYLSDLSGNQLGLPPVAHEKVNKTQMLDMSYVSMSYSQQQIDSSTKVDGEGVNRIVEKLSDIFENNQMDNISLAGVIELYHYKLGEMCRAENALRSSLAAADSYRGQLTRRVAQLSTETKRLHQMLYSSQLTLESTKAELSEIRGRLTAAQEAACTTHIKFKQLKQDAQSKSLIVKEQSEEISKLKNTMEDQSTLIQNLESKNAGMKSANTQLEDKNKALEKELSEQKRLLAHQNHELLELERMRKLIFEITGGKKNI